MAGSLNRVMLIGNLGKDPELRTMTSGKKVASFSMAMTEKWRDKATGERKERAEWATVVIFNEHLVDVAEKYLHKGSKVYVEGQMQTRKWQDKDGADRYTTEVVLQAFGGSIVLLDAAGGGTDRAQAQADARDENGRGAPSVTSGSGEERYRANGSGIPQQARGGRGDFDDDIPFAPEWR